MGAQVHASRRLWPAWPTLRPGERAPVLPAGLVFTRPGADIDAGHVIMDGSRWRGKTTTRRILAIDDEPAILSLTARALSPAGFTVALAATGSRGLAIALQQPFDLVLLDLGLPDLDGEEVLQRLLCDRPRQAVLIWSASTDRQALNRCRALGASGYLRKPFTLTELHRSIAAHCPSCQDPGTAAGSRQTQRR